MSYSDIYAFKRYIIKVFCSFSEEFNAHQYLMTMIEKWYKSLDTWGHAGELLTDLSKAFACIDHKLLIAKLNAFIVLTLKLIYSYLRGKNRDLRYFLHIVSSLKYYLVYLRSQILGHYHLTLTYVILFTIMMN